MSFVLVFNILSFKIKTIVTVLVLFCIELRKFKSFIQKFNKWFICIYYQNWTIYNFQKNINHSILIKSFLVEIYGSKVFQEPTTLWKTSFFHSLSSCLHMIWRIIGLALMQFELINHIGFYKIVSKFHLIKRQI